MNKKNTLDWIGSGKCRFQNRFIVVEDVCERNMIFWEMVIMSVRLFFTDVENIHRLAFKESTNSDLL